MQFILNNEDIDTDLPAGTTVLDFVRYHKNLKGTKIGCREGDCGACTILVGELLGDRVRYRSMTSCLMPLANASAKHIVTIEGINPADGSMTLVQEAIVDESGTQCGFCTVGFVMSLTGFCIDDVEKTAAMAVSSIDGNICRCTGYKSLERAAGKICDAVKARRGDAAIEECDAVNIGRDAVSIGRSDAATRKGSPPSEGGVAAALGGRGGSLPSLIESGVVPKSFGDIADRLRSIAERNQKSAGDGGEALQGRAGGSDPKFVVAGGTDIYVQRPDEIAEADATHVFYDDALRSITANGLFVEIGASSTVTDLLESPVIQSIFPDLYKHLKLVSSTPIRNMATLAGNFVNASPIGDMTVWFLALDADIIFNNGREMPLRKLYIEYKKLAKADQEFIQTIRFRKPGEHFRFNFEKVCKRTYLDIASVNTAISLTVEAIPGPGWVPPALSEADDKSSPPSEGGVAAASADGVVLSAVDYKIIAAHVSCGGVAPIPLYLKETSDFLRGQTANVQTIADANEIMQAEISPISDVRGSSEYKRLLLRQLFMAHFVELFSDISW